jgi:hypothetical protein
MRGLRIAADTSTSWTQEWQLMFPTDLYQQTYSYIYLEISFVGQEI